MLTELIVIVDKSGSMANKESDVVGGFNTFLKEHKALPDPAALTLVFFDTGYEVKHKRVLVTDVPELTRADYRVGGGTALLDAIGKTIKDVEGDGGQPDKTILVIITDGEENSSREYTLAAVKEMIAGRESSSNWETIYLGANVDAFGEAGALGVKGANTAQWNAQSKDGLVKAFASATFSSTGYRGGMSSRELANQNWRPDDADQSKAQVGDGDK